MQNTFILFFKNKSRDFDMKLFYKLRLIMYATFYIEIETILPPLKRRTGRRKRNVYIYKSKLKTLYAKNNEHTQKIKLSIKQKYKYVKVTMFTFF